MFGKMEKKSEKWNLFYINLHFIWPKDAGEVLVIRDSRMFRVRQEGPKHLALRCSWFHWKGLEA
jgi:hypothetical protein